MHNMLSDFRSSEVVIIDSMVKLWRHFQFFTSVIRIYKVKERKERKKKNYYIPKDVIFLELNTTRE